MRDPETEKIILRRKRMGAITLDDLPREQRENYPAASLWGVPVSALYWGYFKFLEKHGYVEFVR